MTRQPWQEVDLNQFNKLVKVKRGRGNQAGRKLKYLDSYATFDVETSRIDIGPDPHAVVYVWMMYFKCFDLMITGRTIQEYIEFMQLLKDHLAEYLVIYVHNLSYEFQFLSGVYDFSNDDVFALKSRKVCKALMMGKYEFRCSAILSNMSLDLYCKKYQVEHGKLSGAEFDYSKVRYPWTDLTPEEWAYCTNDVVGLSECIEVEMRIGKFNIANIPLTSTGFVRKDLKSAMRMVSHTMIPSMQPPYNVYLLLREAFRGGDVHANRYYSNKIISGVHSYDRSSSYPDVLCNCLFPMSGFFPIKDLSDENIIRLQNSRKALLLVIMIRDCRLKNPRWPSPYLARHKCDILETDEDHPAMFDNGRVVRAPLIRTVVTDIDYGIISEQYDGEYTIIEGYYARYGRLPGPFTDCVKFYYSRKTALKGDADQAVFYEKAKNKLNSCYGCTAQDPVKLNTLYLDGVWFDASDPAVPEDLRQNMETQYTEYCRKSWSLYAWGVWCTAWARLRLYEGVKMASMERPDAEAQKDDPHSDFVYSDTDSVKYLGDVDWSKYNAARMQDSEDSGAYADDSKGIRHYMGVYEHDGDYARFITLGSKKYVSMDEDGQLHCTISGVNKHEAPDEILRRGGMESLVYTPRGTFTFYSAGGTELKYNDENSYGSITVDGHELQITKNVAILESTYTLGMTEEYYLLLGMCLKDMDA